jgi:hypothetical protein
MKTKQLAGHRRSSESGFSLAEIAIALFVLALGLLAIVSLFPAAVEFSTDTMMRTEANNIARTAEAELTYRGVLRGLLPGGALYDTKWINVGGNRLYYYPEQGAVSTEGCEGTYSWHATVYDSGGRADPARPEGLLYLQIRVYRNWAVRPTPVAAFDVFTVPSK